MFHINFSQVQLLWAQLNFWGGFLTIIYQSVQYVAIITTIGEHFHQLNSFALTYNTVILVYIIRQYLKNKTQIYNLYEHRTETLRARV